MRWLLFAIIWYSTTIISYAEETHIAVAANFTDAAKEIGIAFEKNTGHKALFSFGATGQLYTQISQNAPFEVFLAADQSRPEKAILEGLAVQGSRFTYATGKIVLFSKNKNLVHGENTLKENNFTKIAIANPMTAPYGAAAIEVMQKLDVYSMLRNKIVQGNNIAQTYQFVHTENAEIGFIALSQVISHDEGSRWIVPDNLYQEISQDAVLLNTGAENVAAKSFIAFLQRPIAQNIIEKYGYGFKK